MAFRRKPRGSRLEPRKQEFSFESGQKEKPAPRPVASKRRPPK